MITTMLILGLFLGLSGNLLHQLFWFIVIFFGHGRLF